MDEILVLFASLGLSVWRWAVYYYVPQDLWPKERNYKTMWILAVLPPLALLGIYVVLKTIASFDVVSNGFYIFYYLVLGLAWLGLGSDGLFYILDISWRDDCLEGGNHPALIAFAGGFVGMTAIYAGANVGDGPGWWCVVFAAGVGTALWFFSAAMLQKTTDIIEKVTLGRDLPAAWRLSFYLAASGLILGRGAAGDWTSFSATLVEFAVAWPIIPLFILAYFAEGSQGSLAGENNSLAWGGAFLAVAVLTYLLAPVIAGPIAALVSKLQ